MNYIDYVKLILFNKNEFNFKTFISKQQQHIKLLITLKYISSHCLKTNLLNIEVMKQWTPYNRTD